MAIFEFILDLLIPGRFIPNPNLTSPRKSKQSSRNRDGNKTNKTVQGGVSESPLEGVSPRHREDPHIHVNFVCFKKNIIIIHTNIHDKYKNYSK